MCYVYSVTEPRRAGRPATGQTPVRTLRIGAIWDQARAIADARGEKLTAVIEDALRRYVRRHSRPEGGDQPAE